MIVFDLACRTAGHRFEGWFGSSGDFTDQQGRGLVACPECGSIDVGKAPMAPNLARKGNQLTAAPKPATEASLPAGAPQSVTKAPLPAEAIKLMQALHAMQAEALKDSRWVGKRFAEESRAMHYGERDAEVIHGQTTAEEAEALLEEGIAVAPLPFPVTPPGEAN